VTIAFVLKGYPRLSETFIAQEILALERRGLDIAIVSLRYPTDKKRHPLHAEIRAPVHYLPEYLYREPLRVAGALIAAAKRPGFAGALRVWLADLKRDPTPNRVRRFGQAAVLAAELGDGIAWLHAHFLHTPSSVARYAAMMLGLPWSASGHAKDIWTTREWELAEKLGAARFAVACTRAAVARLQALAPKPEQVALVHHGLDFARFAPASFARPPRDGRTQETRVEILSVCRLVEKKGIETLLAALARLPADLHWRFTHYGSGPLAEKLRQQAGRRGLGSRIRWNGAAAQAELLEAYRSADLFVLPSRIAADGDRDGLPNVLMEAQSQGLACIATDVSGVPELIDADITGLLVQPGDVEALAAALARLIGDATERARLGAAGAARVAAEFDHARGIEDLLRLFPASLTGRPEPAPKQFACASHSMRP
jgi:glycosyltransferase involved in cell wall biosynthesis